jgi:TolB-like protein
MGAGETTFGPFVLDRSRMALLQDGKAVAVGQRGYALLSALVEADDTVSKTQLMEAAWPGTAVEEGNLTVQVAALRKALGKRADGSEWIVTVPRVGYRLVRGRSIGAEEQVGASPAARHRPSVAVLPFQNLSADGGQEFFADGIVEDIITALSRFKGFAVIARNSSFVYKGRAVDVRQVGRELGVRYVLEGGVRRGGDRLRVTAQLVDAETGAHIWARTFDGKVEDVFTFQDEITASVAGIVYPKIEQAEAERVRRKPPESLDAYELTLRGIELWRTVREPENREAVRLLLRALDLDPEYGLALAALGHVLQYRMTADWPNATANDAKLCLEMTERSLRVADRDGIAQAMAGVTFTNNFGLYDRGVALLESALELNPNSATVQVCSSIGFLHAGDIAMSLSCAHRSIELSPGDPGQHWALTAISHAHMALGQFEQALRWADKSLAVNPDFDCTYWMLVAGNAKLDRDNEAQRWLSEFRTLRPDVTVQSIRQSQPKRYPDRMANILEGLATAGLPTG